MVVQHFDLNMIPGDVIPEIDISQQDTGSGRLVAHLFQKSEEYAPIGSAVIQGTRADGVTFRHNAEIAGSSVVSDIFADMTAASGQARVQVVITEGTNRTGSGVFFLNVQRGAGQ